MTIRSLLAGTALAAAITVLTPALPPQTWGAVTAAQAAVDVSINFNTFYDRLGGYGDWTRFNGNYVFVPANLRPGWRPYVYGHWVLTDNYGWMWISDEPFGWAAYHYGRWGYDPEIGWYWIPGLRWAPAWVSWRKSNDAIVWAPLPPSAGDDIDVGFDAGTIPDYYWVACPARRFLEPNLSIVIIFDERERRRIVDRTQFAGHSGIRNNIAINTVIDVKLIEKQTGHKIKPFAVRNSNEPGNGTVTANEVVAFTGNVKTGGGDSKPGKLKNIDEVKQVQAKRKDKIPLESGTIQSGADTTKPQNLNGKLKTKKDTLPTIINGQQPGQNGQSSDQLQVKKNHKPQQLNDQQNGQTGQPMDQPVKGNKKLQQLNDQQNGQTGQPVDQPVKGNKKLQQLNDQQNGQTGQPMDQPVKGNKKLQQLNNQQKGQNGQNGQNTLNGQTGQPVHKGKKKVCDPKTDVNCPPQP